MPSMRRTSGCGTRCTDAKPAISRYMLKSERYRAVRTGFLSTVLPAFPPHARTDGFVPMCGAQKSQTSDDVWDFNVFYTIDEHITAFDFCNLLFRFVFVRNLASRFNQIAHDLIELRSAFDVMTGTPVCRSIAFRASPATLPPERATSTFSRKPSGAFCLEISVVVASASMLRTNSNVVMLSRRFSFFKPLRFLYCRVFMPDHAFVISSVRIAYSTPFCTRRVPFVGQFLAHLNRLQALVDPLMAVAFPEIGFERGRSSARIDGFLDPFPANLRQPN